MVKNSILSKKGNVCHVDHDIHHVDHVMCAKGYVVTDIQPLKFLGLNFGVPLLLSYVFLYE